MILVLVFAGAEDVYHGSTIIGVMNQYIKGMILGALPNGLWSVIVEFHFYLILPLLVAAFHRRRPDGHEPRRHHAADGAHVRAAVPRHRHRSPAPGPPA